MYPIYQNRISNSKLGKAATSKKPINNIFHRQRYFFLPLPLTDFESIAKKEKKKKRTNKKNENGTFHATMEVIKCPTVGSVEFIHLQNISQIQSKKEEKRKFC